MPGSEHVFRSVLELAIVFKIFRMVSSSSRTYLAGLQMLEIVDEVLQRQGDMKFVRIGVISLLLESSHCGRSQFEELVGVDLLLVDLRRLLGDRRSSIFLLILDASSRLLREPLLLFLLGFKPAFEFILRNFIWE